MNFKQEMKTAKDILSNFAGNTLSDFVACFVKSVCAEVNFGIFGS